MYMHKTGIAICFRYYHFYALY